MAALKTYQEVSIVASLKACAKSKDLFKGSRLHADVVLLGLLAKNIFIGNALVDMYAKCGAVGRAQQVFDVLPFRDVVSWTALIGGYTQKFVLAENALVCFDHMQLEGLPPNAVTFICILKACGSIGDVEKGEEVHNGIVREGLLGNDNLLSTALVDMYAKCGALGKAQKVFDNLVVQDIGPWNALIAGYALYGHGDQVMDCYEGMQQKGFVPNAVTFLCLLKACSVIQAMEKGRGLHVALIKEGLLGGDVMLGNALVNMYGKCGALAKAQQLLDELPVRNVITWNALIAGYSQNELGEIALCCFEQMQNEALSPDTTTFVCILKACGSIVAAEKGKEMHDQLAKLGKLEKITTVGNAVVDMYAKCGTLPKAQEVFERMSVQNVVSWNALIVGYSQNGHGKEAVNCFKQMKCEGLSPDAVTFLCVLSACSCSGLVGEGQLIFNEMKTMHDIKPTLDHLTCMVDLFGCEGCFDEALAIINEVPSSSRFSLWLALLGACRKRGNVMLGRLVFQQGIVLDEESAVLYAYMSDIYAAAGMQVGSNIIEALRQNDESQMMTGEFW